MRKLRLFGTSSLLLVVLLIVPVAPSDSGEELVIAHETFEPQASWTWRGTYAVDDDGSGKNRALRLEAEAGSAAKAIAGPIRLLADRGYRLSWRCRTEGVTRPVTVGLRLDERVLQEFEHVIQAGTTDWIAHNILFKALPGEEQLQVVLSVPEEGTAWFDDFELVSDPSAFRTSLRAVQATRLTGTDGFPGTICVSPLTRIAPESILMTELTTAAVVTLDAAANETEQVMLVLRPDEPLSDLSIETSDLVGPETIPAGRVSWRLVDFVELPAVDIRSPSGWAGRVSDPLLPVDSFDAPAGENTPVLLQVDVPRDALPGTYRGELRVLARAPIVLPIELRVRDFALPDFPPIVTEANFRAAPGDLTAGAVNPLIENLFGHAVSPRRAIATELEERSWIHRDGTQLHIDFELFDAVVNAWTDRGIDEFVLPPIGLRRRGGAEHHMAEWLGLEALTPEFNEVFAEYLSQLEVHLIERNWIARAYLYLWDEPTLEEIPTYAGLLRLVRDAAPRIRTAVAGSRLPHPDLYGLIDVWIVNLRRQILAGGDWATIRERQALGETVGAYGNNRYALDLPLAYIRLWPWTLAKHGLTLTGWYSVNGWPEDPWAPSEVRLGSGYLLYPSPTDEGEVLDSLRWEALRAGMEDVSYLELLAERTEQVRASLGGGNVFSGDRLVQQFIAPLVWGTTERDFSSDEPLIERVRSLIGDEIEAAASDPPLLVAIESVSEAQATIHLLTDPGARVTIDGEPIELQDGRYTGEIARGSETELLVTIRVQLGGETKTIVRFWPTDPSG